MCNHCENNTPHIHYYLEKHIKQFNSFDDALETTKREMETYHNEYGKYGFLSEHTGDEYLTDSNIISRAKKRWDIDQTAEYDANKAACHNISELNYLLDSPNFVRFL